MSTTLSLFAQPTVIVALLCVWMLLLCLGFFAHLHFVLIVIFSTVVSEELRTVPLHMVEMTVKPLDLMRQRTEALIISRDPEATGQPAAAAGEMSN